MNHYWSENSWGSMTPPTNADEIIFVANQKIDEYIEANPDADDWEIDEYSSDLWELYTQDDGICGITNIYEEESR